jgi:predicted acetyltransferase
MSMPDGFELVPLTPERLSDVLTLDMWAFPTGDSFSDLLELPSPLTWERAFGVVRTDRPDELVAMRASYPFGRTPVPGGHLQVAGLTWVGVHPQWRRRGLLRAMIDDHFAHCRDRGEPLSLLFAAEPAIYGRFGYGLASRSAGLTLPRRAALREIPEVDDFDVRIETVEFERHADLIGRLHAAVDRPGWVTRESPELARYWLSNAPLFRNGREVQRILVVERAGLPVAYALFRRKLDWGRGGAEGVVQVVEAVAADPSAAHVLWSRLLDLDLTTQIRTEMLAPDDPLFSLLVDQRAGQATGHDNLWARIIDLPAALRGRRYQADLDVVLDVTDTLLPDNAGRWRLTASAFDTPTVARTDDPADLALDVRELGAAYLGGTSLVELAGAGLVTETTPDTLQPASVAFGWPKLPVASWIF